MSNEVLHSTEFLTRLLSGEREAFSELLDLTSPRIYALGLRMLGNGQDAEDILQETYIKAFRSLKTFESRSSVETWLFRIAANEALMLLRKGKKSSADMDLDADKPELEEAPEIVDWCCLPEHELMNTETRTMLEKAAGSLSPNLRMVFLLREIQDFSVKETAEILGVSEDVVKTRLVRARLKLREELSVYFRERMGSEVNDG